MYMTTWKIIIVSICFVSKRFEYFEIDQHLLLQQSIDEPRALSCAPIEYSIFHVPF